MWSGQAFAQNAVPAWFPVHVGDRWTYEHETRDQTDNGPSDLEVHRWTTEETISGTWNIPQGTLVGMQVRITEGAPRRGYRVDPNPAYLIRGDCFYRLGSHDWEPSSRQLSQEFLRWLGVGEISADFCFPLVVHKAWGAPNWGGTRPAKEAKDWEVAGIVNRDPSAPDKQKTFHITSVSSYLGSGETGDIWFEQGIGIVREEDVHHGPSENFERTFFASNAAPCISALNFHASAALSRDHPGAFPIQISRSHFSGRLPTDFGRASSLPQSGRSQL